jgi:serine protease AprX
MMLKKLKITGGALMTVALLVAASRMCSQEPAPASAANAGPEDAKNDKKQDKPKDPGRSVDPKDKAAVPQPEVLCERTEFEKNSFIFTRWIFNNCEVTSKGEKKSSGQYGLSSITVSPCGWKIHAIAIHTTNPSRPEGWLKLGRARLNVFPKKGALPAAQDDPRLGQEVEVAVREVGKGVYEVRVSDLQLTLEPGEYWIGLTPIWSAENGDPAYHSVARGNVRDARSEDVFWEPNDGEAGRNWSSHGPAGNEQALGEHLSVRIEGWRVPRGQILDWPAEKGKNTKQLHLRFGTFDPLANFPKIPEELTAPEDGKLWIVQCRDTVDQQARDQLTKAGATLLRYLPDDAYIARLAPDTVKKVRELPAVRWVGPYHAAYRLDPDVFPKPVTRVLGIMGLASQALERKGERAVFVYLFERNEAAKKVVAQVIRDAGGKVVFKSPKGFYLAANVPLDKLATLARCDAVCAIERRFGAFYNTPSQGQSGKSSTQGGKGLITLAQIRELCGAEAVKKAGGYEGLGVRVAFFDGGIREDHVDLLGRPLTVLGPKQWLPPDHGTAVASILCGEGRGDPRARGLLPAGGLVFAGDRSEPSHEDRYLLVELFVRDHRAVVLSCSVDNWGGTYGYINHYDGYSFLLDDLVLEHDLLICGAGGNSTKAGVGMSGSWAKNALVVGGIHPHGSVQRGDHRYGYFSGPALDGRVKPDLVHFANGVFCANASSPKGYGPFGGTSCATPLVAGHCGLMMEMWADGAFGNLPPGITVSDRKPHAATAKALMINSAYRYPIEGKKPVLTRFQQGWGMPDVGRLYDSRKKLFVVDQETALGDHQAIEYRLRVPEGEAELRVTMVYTDPLGTTSAAKALVNDLDLIVIAPDGKRYLGNHGLMEGNVSREGGSPDRINNVENVFLEKPAPGVWRVIVAAHRIASDQHRGTEEWDQDFAVVVSGVERDPVPAKTLSK